MKTIDKEHERQTMQATPEYKKKAKRSNLLYGAFIAILFVGAILYSRSPCYTGTPHTMQIAGMAIEPGKTTVQELADYGFELSDSMAKATGRVYSPLTTVATKSYISFLSLMMDGEDYATISIVNEDIGSKPIMECIVREIYVNEYDVDYQNAVVDGVKLSELTVQHLTQANGEPNESYPVDDGAAVQTQWEDAHYSIEIVAKNDGTVKKFQIKYE